LASLTAIAKAPKSWRELLLDLHRRGLTRAPDLAIGNGALGVEGADSARLDALWAIQL
jgi:hypothetical protein